VVLTFTMISTTKTKIEKISKTKLPTGHDSSSKNAAASGYQKISYMIKAIMIKFHNFLKFE